jgi:hypothetical protein
MKLVYFYQTKHKNLSPIVNAAFPHLEAEAWGPHVAIWNRAEVERIMATDPEHYGTDAREAVRKAAESDEVGELLGNGARTRQAGNATVWRNKVSVPL